MRFRDIKQHSYALIQEVKIAHHVDRFGNLTLSAQFKGIELKSCYIQERFIQKEEARLRKRLLWLAQHIDK